MLYRVKLKKNGISIFCDKDLADKCAEENKTKVEVVMDTDRDIKTDRKNKEG